MDGIFGWLGEHSAHQDLIKQMGQAAQLSPEVLLHSHSSQILGVAACSRFGKAHTHVENGLAAALTGRPQFVDDELAFIARDQNPAVAVAHGWMRYGEKLPTLMRGNFAFAVLEPLKNKACLVLDRIGSERLCYAHRNGQLAFGTSVQSVAAHPAVGRTIDPQAIYDYLYFHTIPAPRSVYQGVHKLLPGQILTLNNGQVHANFYWQADYTPVGADFDTRRSNFRTVLDQAVRDADVPGTAAFLSGGTDSSTVVGALTAARGAPVDTFSIGFDAAGFDEMEYARCAVERYGSRPHEYYLKPADIVTAIPLIAREYDEPFGNASAVPTYFCAKAAHDAGFKRMLAGDGGDEIFGGNVRYAKQRLFEFYARLPALLRHGVIEPIAHLPGLSNRFPLAKLNSYVTQAKVPMPDRLMTYNLLFRLGVQDVLTPALLAQVDQSAPERQQRAVWAEARTDSLVNRMLAFDWRYALADCDLPKVVGTTALAGLEVGFPMLDDQLLAFSMRLPTHYKLKGLRLRWFFKEALRGFLPDEIITKKKQGFGLPFGVWANTDPDLKALASDSLINLAKRGIVRTEFVEQLLTKHLPEHSGWGEMVWILMMLEQWLAAKAPGFAISD